MKVANWWGEGVKFECQGSGKCCTSHGEHGFVFLTLKDRQQMAKLLGMPTQSFTRKYCQKYKGLFHLIDQEGTEDCIFLDQKKCRVYAARPTQCRTWPFWPENMPAKTWKKDIASFCPGVGRGQKFSKDEIETTLKLQMDSEDELLSQI